MPIPTKALSAYLVTRNTSLAASITMLGQDPKCLNNESISDDVAGRIARLLGLTPEKLIALSTPFIK